MFKNKKTDKTEKITMENNKKEATTDGSKKKSKKSIIIIVAVALIALLTMCGKDGDQKVDKDFKNAQIIDIMNGSNTKVIGQTSVIKMKSEDVTDEFLINWSKNHLQTGDYNWGVIVYTDKGNDDLGVYGTGDFILTDVQLQPKDDGSYAQGGSTQTTMMCTVDGDKLIKDDAGVSAEEEAENKQAISENKENEASKDKEYDRKNTTKVIAQSIIEEQIEKQRMKGFAPSADFTVAKYSDEPIKDKDGNEYPVSYMVSGQYEEKGSGALRDFVMCIAYKSEEDLDNNGTGYCLQYLNQDTNKYFNNVAKEDDIFEKLQDLNQ